MKLNYPIFTIILVVTTNSYCVKNKKNSHKSYKYLQSEPFKERSRLAAQWVKDIDTVVEIGGGQNPISKYTSADQKIIVIDPEIKRKEEHNITHIGKLFENWDGAGEINGKKYAVIILGLELKMQQDGWNKLFDLINNSQKTVIEYSVTFKTAKNQVKDILNNTDKKITETKDFDLSNHNYKDCPIIYPLRTIICLE